MNITIALKLICNMILILPVLAMIIYLVKGLYHLKQGDERCNAELKEFAKGIPALGFYIVTAIAVIKEFKLETIDISYIILIPISVLYLITIIDDELDFGFKLLLSIAGPVIIFSLPLLRSFFQAN